MRVLLSLLLLLSGACDRGMSGVRRSADGGTQGDAAVTDDAATLRLPLDSFEQLGEVPFGTPEGKVVYDLGSRLNISPDHLHIDGDGMYWAARGPLWIYRGSADGRRGTEELGRCYKVCADHLATDPTHVYWLDGPILRRRGKDLSPEQTVELPWDHTGGDLLADERYVYVAMPGCAAITRLDNATFAQETADSPVPRGVGRTALARAADGTVYCASWRRVLRVADWAKPEVLYESAQRISGVQVSATHAYWLDNALDDSFARVTRMPLAGGAIEHFQLPIEGGVSKPVLHEPTNELFFLKANWIVKLDLERAEFSYLVRDYLTSLAVWQGKIYWTVWDGRGSEWGAIRQLEVGITPVFSFEARGWSQASDLESLR